MLGSSKPQLQLRTGLSASQIRVQLEKILASETFGRSERLSAFLRYVVEETLRGNGHTLKEQVIAHDVYGRGDGYDPNADPIVRVDARRLRDKLREYYAAAEGESVLISLPKGSYVPVFENGSPAVHVIVPAPEPVVLPARRGLRGRTLLIAVAVPAIFSAAVGWFAIRKDPGPQLRIRPLTISPGNKGAPSLSPDGNFVVFAWSNDGPPDLYIKAVDGESIHRLTETPQPEFSAAWSPDGRHIAFVRGGEGVFIISTLGGTEHKIADSSRTVAWAANSKSVFVNHACPSAPDVYCVYQVTLDTLDKRQVTNPASGNGDWGFFAASPDGRTLAVSRNSARAGLDDVYLVSLAGGDARRVTTQNRFISGVAWTPDGRDLIYSVLDGTRFRLWRTAARAGGGNGQPITALGQSAEMPSVARNATGGHLRIAYQTRIHDVGLRLVELNPSGPVDPVGTATPLADTIEGRDCSARFSPDASQIAFYSVRSGEGRMWLINRDGSGLRPLTPIVAQEIKPGAWSPDGRRLVFDAGIDGNGDIYITDIRGSQPFRLTSEPSTEVVPAWSPDGRWVYFASDRSGSYQIWKAPAAGGSATQLTFQGGFRPQPSTDGAYVYYATPPGAQQRNILKRVPATGGEESAVLEEVRFNYWTVTSKGIYLLLPEQGRGFLERYDPATGQRTRLGVLPFPPAWPHCGFMNVSQDGRYLVANHTDRNEMNLGVLDVLR